MPLHVRGQNSNGPSSTLSMANTAKEGVGGAVRVKAFGQSQSFRTARPILGDIGNRAPSNSDTLGKKKAEDGFKKPLQPTKSTVLSKKQTGDAKPALHVPIPMDISLSDSKNEVDMLEVIEAFSSQRLNAVDVDEGDFDNPQLVSTYVNDIYNYLRCLEREQSVTKNYLAIQKLIKPSMRGILVDWLVEVHARFRLLPETLFLTVAVLDRFLQADCQTERPIDRPQLQLVGVTAMFIASKYEEMYAPEIDDFVFITDKAYTTKDILAMECRILSTLDFKLGRPLPLHFLRRYTKAGSAIADKVDSSHHTLAKYLIELTLPEYDFCYYAPSYVAAAALCLSLKVLDTDKSPNEKLWCDTLTFYARYTYAELEPLMAQMSALIIKSETAKLQAVRKKFASSKLYSISSISQLKNAVVQSLAAKALVS